MSFTDKLYPERIHFPMVYTFDTIYLSQSVLSDTLIKGVYWVFLFYLMSIEIWDSQVNSVASSKCTRVQNVQKAIPTAMCDPQLLLGKCKDQLTQDSYMPDLTRECVEPNPGPLTGTNKPKRYYPKQRRYNPNNNQPRQYDPTLPYSHFMKPIQNVQKYSEIVKLSYAEGSQPLNNAGSSIQVLPLYTNDGFDLFPGILTPTVPFINNKFSLYKFAKISHIKFYFAFNNLETFAVDVYFFASAQSMASIFSTPTVINTMAVTKNLVWTSIIPEQFAKETIYAEFGVNPWRSLGNWQEYNSSNDFSFTQSTNPARLTHGALVIRSATGAALTNGITYRLMMDITLKFYDPVDLTAPLFRSLVTKEDGKEPLDLTPPLRVRVTTPNPEEPTEIVIDGKRYILKQ